MCYIIRESMSYGLILTTYNGAFLYSREDSNRDQKWEKSKLQFHQTTRNRYLASGSKKGMRRYWVMLEECISVASMAHSLYAHLLAT